MTNQKIDSILQVIKRPNATFREIYQNGNDYFKISIIVLVVSSFFTVTFTIPSENIAKFPTNELGYILDAEMQIIDNTVNILNGFLFVVLVFFVGKKFGGSKNFRGVFSVLSYSFVPILIGGIIVSIFLYYPPLLESVSGIDLEDPIFPQLFWVLYLGIFFPFSIWSLILSIKAIKIANNFGTWKTIGIIILTFIIMAIISIPFFNLNLIDHPYFSTDYSIDSITDDTIDSTTAKTNYRDRIFVGFSPDKITLNPNTNMIYVSYTKYIPSELRKVIGSTETEEIAVINGSEGIVMMNITKGITSLNKTKGIAVINGTTHTLVDNISLPDKVSDLVVNPNTNTVFATINYHTIPDNPDRKFDSLFVIDGNTNNVTKILKMGGSISNIAVNPKTNTIYPINNFWNSFAAIDLSNIEQPTYLSDFKSPRDVEVNPSTDMIYVTNSGAKRWIEGEYYSYPSPLFVIDGKTNSIITQIDTGEKIENVVVNTKTNKIYLTSAGQITNDTRHDDDLVVVDGFTNTVVGKIKVPTALSFLDVNSKTNMVYLANEIADTVFVIDGKTNDVIKSISVGNSPNGIAVNENTNLIYVANHDSISVINGTTNELIQFPIDLYWIIES